MPDILLCRYVYQKGYETAFVFADFNLNVG